MIKKCFVVPSVYTRLHLLNEIEENMHVFMNLGQDDGGKVTSQDLLSQWQTRLKMMQVPEIRLSVIGVINNRKVLAYIRHLLSFKFFVHLELYFL